MSCPDGYEKTSKNTCLPNCKANYSSDGIDKCYRFCIDLPADDNYCSILPCPNGGIFNLKIDKSNRRSSYSGTCSGPGISTYSANTNNVPDIYIRDAKLAIPIKKKSSKKNVKKVAKFTNTNNYFEYYVIFVCLIISLFLYYLYLK
jgi:hypothetical protein